MREIFVDLTHVYHQWETGKEVAFRKTLKTNHVIYPEKQCESRSVGFRESELGLPLPELCRFWELCGFFNSSRGRGAVETEVAFRESPSSAVGPPSEVHIQVVRLINALN